MKLGDKISVSCKYVKSYEFSRTIYKIKNIKQKDGFYLGKRVIKEGVTTHSLGEGVYFTPKNSITVALVVCDLRGLIYVPISHLEEMND